MARRRTKVLAGVLGAGAVAGMAWLGVSVIREKRTFVPAPTTAAAPAPRAHVPAFKGDRASGCQLTAGQSFAYNIDIRTMTEVHPERMNLPPGSRVDGVAPARATFANLDLRVLREVAAEGTNGPGAIVLGRFADVDPGTTTEVGAIDAPFLLRISDRCKITGYARLATTPALPARTQQALAHELQWLWPQGDDLTATDEGETAFGQYRASYTATAGEGKSATIAREIEAYTRVWERGQGFGQASTDKPAISTMKVVPGAGPWFESIESREKLVGMSVVDTDTATHVSARPANPAVLAGAATDESQYSWGDMFRKRTPKLARAQQRGPEHIAAVEEMRQVKLPVALDKMYDAINADANIARVWPVLEAYLEAHPDEAQTVVDKLKAGEIPEGAQAATFIALGQTPTPQARTALWHLKDDKRAHVMMRAQSAFALVDRADVDVSLAQSLLEDSSQVVKGRTRSDRLFSREAALALGMMSGLKADDDEIRAVATKGVVSLLQAGHDATTLSPGFNALANIGDPGLLGHASPFMKSADPKIRERAAIVFRRMPPAETVHVTADWLARESDAFVQRALYKTLQAQLFDAKEPPDARIIDLAIRDLTAQPGTLTRQSLIHILGAVAGENPRAREALIRQVKHEQNDGSGLLKQLGQYLKAEDIGRGMVM
jgi:hypothetical protein